MYLLQNQQLAQFHRDDLLREAGRLRAGGSTNTSSEAARRGKQNQVAIRRACLVAFSLGMIAGGMLNSHFGFLPAILLGSLMAFVLSLSLLIQLTRAFKACRYTFRHSRTGSGFGNARLSK